MLRYPVKVSALLTLPAIRELNASVDVYNEDPTLVAKHFLQANGLLPLTGCTPVTEMGPCGPFMLTMSSIVKVEGSIASLKLSVT